MRVLFVYTNINGFHEDCYSIGLASIVAVTRRDGHQVSMIIVTSKEEYLKVLDRVAEFKPRVVGFSSVSSQFTFVKEIAALIKAKNSNIITVCGGIHSTINPSCVLETNFLDGIFIGESEGSFSEFLKKVEYNQSYRNTDNFAYVRDGEVVINKLKPLITDLDTIPYPDKEICPFEDTLKLSSGYAHFFFTRGCPYSCSYCSNHAIAKAYNLRLNFPRFRSPESSIREIEEAMGRFNIHRIVLGDDIFGLDKKWREEFCKKYKERIKIKFLCLLRANLVDEEFIRLLKDAGCYRISMGIESGNEYIRNIAMNRNMSNRTIEEAFSLVRKYGLEAIAINIIGLPGETKKMIRDTIKLNRKVSPTWSLVNIFYPYKGTKLGDHCFKNDLVNDSLYQSFSNERRETVLNFPEEHKKKLVYYKENWELLIYPFDLKRRLKKWLAKMFMGTFIWTWYRKLKWFTLKKCQKLS